MATWGHQAAGVSETQLLHLERDAMACSGISTAGRCRAIGLLVAYGVLGTARARIIRETLRDWFGMLRLAESQPNAIENIRSAWAKAKSVLRNNNNNIQSVHGIMSNLIHMLIQAKWNPVAYNMWVDPCGTQWVTSNFVK